MNRWAWRLSNEREASDNGWNVGQRCSLLVVDNAGVGFSHIVKSVEGITGLRTLVYNDLPGRGPQTRLRSLRREGATGKPMAIVINLDGMSKIEQGNLYGLTGECSHEGKYVSDSDGFRRLSMDHVVTVFVTSKASRRIHSGILNRMYGDWRVSTLDPFAFLVKA